MVCLTLIAALLVGVLSVNADFPKWNHLSVTFKEYSPMPMNERDAIAQGWELWKDNCEDQTGPFVGKRYALNKDLATVLIYDHNGHIAGQQMGYKQTAVVRKYKGAYQIVGEYTFTTAYYTDADNICNKNVTRPTDVIGDKLIFLTGIKKYMEVPKLRKDIGSTKFVEGACFPMMGKHYWYDISKEMDCRDVFPAFILYNREGQLDAFGFLSGSNVPGGRPEHPPGYLLWLFFNKETQPKCLPDMKYRSTQHVYFTKIGWFTHLCWL